MSREFRQIDADGFPVPPKFEDIRYHDDSPSKSRRTKVNPRVKRWILIGALVGIIIPIVLGPMILAGIRGAYAGWLGERAEEKIASGDFDGALADLNTALEWSPDDWKAHAHRGRARQELNDLNGAAEDYTKALQLLASSDNALLRDGRGARLRKASLAAELHLYRSTVNMRLGRGRQAIDDCTRALDLHPHLGARANLLNSRAYARAQAGLELKEGLDDIERAIELERSDNEAFLDTRAYLLHLLGENEKALRDINKAISLVDQYKLDWLQQGVAGNDGSLLRRQLKLFDENKAVMHQHRSLIYAALGREEEAQTEHELALELGYDPTRGEK